MGKADLHIHSTASDGKLEPDTILDLAADKGLDTIALTDHDTLAGYFEIAAESEKKGVKILPGVEVTAKFRDREAHLLAYCFEVHDDSVVQLIADHKKARIERIHRIVNLLGKQGLEIDVGEVKAEARGANPGRPHIAAVLIKKGYVAGFKEAFIRYLSDEHIGSVETSYYSYRDVIRVFQEAAGAVILAHPATFYSDEELEQFVKDGIDGIEAIHPSHTYNLQKKYEDLAREHDLLITGGSDFHGGDPEYLPYFGVTTISETKVQKLVSLARYRQTMLA